MDRMNWMTILLLTSVLLYRFSDASQPVPAGHESRITNRGHHHRHHRHHHHQDSLGSGSKQNATTELKQMMQSSPKDALIVTKRRYLRKDWCQSQPLMQRVGQDHCLSTTILNRFCYGQCNSFYIPKNQMKGGGDTAAAAFKSCGTAI